MDALHQIVDALDLDRAVVWLRDENSDDFYPAQRWAREGVPATTERLSVRALFPWHWQRIMAGDVAVYSRVSDIPDAVTRDKRDPVWRARRGHDRLLHRRRRGGLRRVCDHPRRSASGRTRRSAGCICVSRVFANAIARQRNDRALAAALSQVQRLSERLKDENAYLRSEVEQVQGDFPIDRPEPGRSCRRSTWWRRWRRPTPACSCSARRAPARSCSPRQVHELSARHHRLMVRVNCAAIPDTLLESELFGREKGAYTGALTRQTGRFELADKSTIFLDEIGDLPLEVQVKLLRVLEDRQVERLGSSRSIHVDVRIVAATHRNLEEMVARGHVPRGSLLPPQRLPHPRAAAARAAGRHPAAGLALHGRVLEARSASR